MNKTQRVILYVTSIVVLLMVLFPPYSIVYRGEILASGYAFIFALPKSVAGFEGSFASAVNVATLVTQIIGILAAGLLSFWASKGTSPV